MCSGPKKHGEKGTRIGKKSLARRSRTIPKGRELGREIIWEQSWRTGVAKASPGTRDTCLCHLHLSARHDIVGYHPFQHHHDRHHHRYHRFHHHHDRHHLSVPLPPSFLVRCSLGCPAICWLKSHKTQRLPSEMPSSELPTVGKSEVGILIITHHQKCLP